jgi:hypothetical protein
VRGQRGVGGGGCGSEREKAVNRENETPERYEAADRTCGRIAQFRADRNR